MALTLIPAYGRDYKTKKEVIADFKANKDFIIANFFHPSDGKPCNLEDLKSEGKEKQVMIRYKKLTQTAMINI